METLPEEGEVFVTWIWYEGNRSDTHDYDVSDLRNVGFANAIGYYAAWSYTATTNPNIIHSIPIIKERCEEIAASIRKGIADEEDARALDAMAMEIEANYTATTKEPT